MFNKPTGFIPDRFDPRDRWENEIGVGEEVDIPNHYRTEGLNFDHQGAFPYCVSYAVTTALENAIRSAVSTVKAFSQPHLFYHSGGSTRGSNIRDNLNTARDKGCIAEARMRTPELYPPPGWFDKYRDEAESIPFTDTSKVKNYLRIQTDEVSIQLAIIKYGAVITSLSTVRTNVVTQPSYWSKKFNRFTKADNHSVLLVGWDEDIKGKYWIIFDSLDAGVYEKGDHFGLPKGYHRISRAYNFYSGYVLTEIVHDELIKEVIENNRKDGFDRCLSHYGEPRNFAKEQEVAGQLVKEFEKFKNQSVWEAAGKFWTVYINAVTYGGYNISYKKLGLWQSGDVINDCYNWRRTNKHIFDFNMKRGEPGWRLDGKG